MSCAGMVSSLACSRTHVPRRAGLSAMTRAFWSGTSHARATSEVQVLADAHGSIVHPWERDCSVQRRHQKVVQVAPAANLSDDARNAICEAAIRVAKATG